MDGRKQSLPRDEVSLDLVPVGPGTGTIVAGKYEVLEQFARLDGRSGYRVRHTVLGSILTMTSLPALVGAPAGALARVQAAVRDASQLQHRHILPVVDLIDATDRYYVVEALADATPLGTVLAGGGLSATDVLQIASQVADALAYGHERGLVHGAVGPANVVVERAAQVRAWLGGFALSAFPFPGITTTPAYAAPEQVTGGAIDACTDVFGLGLLLFELLEGRPFLTGDPREIETLLRDGTGPFVPRFAHPVPAGVSALIARALRRTPSARHQKMSHVRSELDGCLRAAGKTTPAQVATTPVRDAIGQASEPRPKVAAPTAGKPVVKPEPGWSTTSGPGTVVVEQEAAVTLEHQSLERQRRAGIDRDRAVEMETVDAAPVVPELEPVAATDVPRPATTEPASGDEAAADAIEVQPFARRFPHDPIVDASADAMPEFVAPPPTFVNPRAATARRGFWPKRMGRQPMYAPNVLIRASAPRRATPVGGKFILGALAIALGWPLLHFDFQTSAAGRTMKPRPEIQFAAATEPERAPSATATPTRDASAGPAPAAAAPALPTLQIAAGSAPAVRDDRPKVATSESAPAVRDDKPKVATTATRPAVRESKPVVETAAIRNGKPKVESAPAAAAGKPKVESAPAAAAGKPKVAAVRSAQQDARRRVPAKNARARVIKTAKRS